MIRNEADVVTIVTKTGWRYRVMDGVKIHHDIDGSRFITFDAVGPKGQGIDRVSIRVSEVALAIEAVE